MADDGIVARIAFLLRRNRVDEAAELLEFSRTSLARRPAFTLLEAGLAEKRDRMQDAEEIYRRLIDTADVPDDQRRQATVRLALCLVDRNKAQDAYTLADRAVLEWGPHPDLLDARGVASIATGNTAGAIRDLSEAVLAPTPERRLHLAFAKMLTDALAEARDVIQAAAKSGLQMESLRPTDRERLDTLTRRLGLALR